MSRYTVFTGVGTALITPFDASGHVDLDTLGKLIDRQIKGGADAIVMTGTTGESPTLTGSEKREIWRLARERIDASERRVPLIAGSGSNDTAVAAKLSHNAELDGADALLVVTPYYNKSSPRGIVEHYKAISRSVSLPIIAYTVPSRTGIGIPLDVWSDLAAIPNLVGVKDATGDIHHTSALCAALGASEHPNALAVYSGDDESTLPVLALGGCGVISVVSNLIPEEIHEMCRCFAAGENGAALDIWRRTYSLIRALSCDVNPIPIKAALSELGLCSPYLRLPLVPLDPHKREILSAHLNKPSSEQPHRSN